MFADRFKALRKENKISQSTIAEKLNLSQATIASWESNTRNPTVDDIPKIAEYFDVSVDYLLGLTDDPSAQKEPATSGGLGVIVDKYRQLTPENQGRIADLIEALLSSQAQSPVDRP